MKVIQLNPAVNGFGLGTGGRIEGEKARLEHGLPALDGEQAPVQIVIPSEVISLPRSFLLGLFEESIHVLGEKGFRERYQISSSPEVAKDVDLCIQGALGSIVKPRPNVVVDLRPYVSDGTAIKGGAEGRQARWDFALATLEHRGGPIPVVIPEEVKDLDPDFFRGMFEHVLRKRGEADFRALYQFSCSPEVRGTIESSIQAMVGNRPPVPAGAKIVDLTEYIAPGKWMDIRYLKGMEARQEHDLRDSDLQQKPVYVMGPEKGTFKSPRFFKEMFEHSIARLGKEQFRNVYHFLGSPRFQQDVEFGIEAICGEVEKKKIRLQELDEILANSKAVKEYKAAKCLQYTLKTQLGIS